MPPADTGLLPGWRSLLTISTSQPAPLIPREEQTQCIQGRGTGFLQGQKGCALFSSICSYQASVFIRSHH